MSLYSRLLSGIIFAVCAVGCTREPERPCNGTVSAEAVAAGMPVIEAFRAHLASRPATDDIEKFLADYRHYALSITSTESQFIFEFVPRDEGLGFKGGGARYRVSRATGTIEETLYMK